MQNHFQSYIYIKLIVTGLKWRFVMASAKLASSAGQCRHRMRSVSSFAPLANRVDPRWVRPQLCAARPGTSDRPENASPTCTRQQHVCKEERETMHFCHSWNLLIRELDFGCNLIKWWQAWDLQGVKLLIKQIWHKKKLNYTKNLDHKNKFMFQDNFCNCSNLALFVKLHWRPHVLFCVDIEQSW